MNSKKTYPKNRRNRTGRLCEHPSGLCQRPLKSSKHCQLHHKRYIKFGDCGPLEPIVGTLWLDNRICEFCDSEFNPTNIKQKRCIECIEKSICKGCGEVTKLKMVFCMKCKNKTDIKCKAECGRNISKTSKSGFCKWCNREGLTSGIQNHPAGYTILSKHKNHPNATKRGTIPEHVLVMSNYINRPLIKGETVHHLNGIKNDNRIENLELWSKEHGSGQRVSDKIRYALEIIETYGYDPEAYEDHLEAENIYVVLNGRKAKMNATIDTETK